MDGSLGLVGRDAGGLQRLREGGGALDGRRRGSRHRLHHECGLRGWTRFRELPLSMSAQRGGK